MSSTQLTKLITCRLTTEQYGYLTAGGRNCSHAIRCLIDQAMPHGDKVNHVQHESLEDLIRRIIASMGIPGTVSDKAIVEHVGKSPFDSQIDAGLRELLNM